MEEERKLYPMRFCTLQDEYSWGADEFKLADLGYRDSLVNDGWLAGNSIGEVMDMYMDRIVGERVFGVFGRQFPVQVKYIHVSGRQPLRVHPDDGTARERYDFLGREKLWYVVRAGSGSGIWAGFERPADASELFAACGDGSVEKLLHVEHPKAGDFFHIAPGVVHGAFGDILIAEISESSPLDFCICGWGQPVSPDEFDESLGLVEALDFIDYSAYRPEAGAKAGSEPSKLLSLKEFTVTRIPLAAPLHILAAPEDESFSLYSCVSGSATVKLGMDAAAEAFQVREGETLLVPAECPDIVLSADVPGTVLLETMVEPSAGADPYINPDAAESLPEDE